MRKPTYRPVTDVRPQIFELVLVQDESNTLTEVLDSLVKEDIRQVVSQEAGELVQGLGNNKFRFLFGHNILLV